MRVIFYITKCILMFLYKYQIYIASVITLITFGSIIFRIRRIYENRVYSRRIKRINKNSTSW